MPDVMPASPLDARRLGQLEQHDTLAARNARLVGGDIVRMRVRRFDAELGRAEFQEFEVPYRKWMRVLDALNWIAENQAPDLAYRWFCGSKMCGTCAVRMNGREVLACWEAVEPVTTIEPLKAKTAELIPTMARHSLALRTVVAVRGRVDPGALVLRVQGLRTLANLPRIVRLWARGKIDPIRTFLKVKTAASGAARRLLGREVVSK